MRGPRGGGLLSIAPLLLAGCVGAAFSSCATSPAAAPEGGAAVAMVPEGAGGGPAQGGTAIRPAQNLPMSKVQSERKAIEEAIAFGSPASLTLAFERIAASTSLDKSELRLLAWVGARVASIVYPLRSSSFVPQDLRNQGEIPAGSLARMVSEALSGRVPDLAKEDAGDPLAELLPALAVFRSDSRETARFALVALDRYDTLGPPSVIPAIVRGLDAERRKAWPEALSNYLKARDLAADAWPAILGAARAELAVGKPKEALDLIAAVPKDIQEDPDFSKVKAEALYENASFAEADPLVAQALLEDPLDATLMLMRAHLLIRAKQWQQALPLLDAYSTVDQASRTLVLLRCLASEGLRNRDDAIRWARRGLELSPDDPEFLTILARLLLSLPSLAKDERLAAVEEARTDARRSYDLTAEGATIPPGLSPARLVGRADAGNEAARLLLEEAASRYDWIGAVQYLDRARRAPGFGNESLVGLVLRKSGNWSRALDHATLWYRANPNSESAAEAYLRALIGTGNIKAAEDLLPRLLLAPGTTAGRSRLHYLQSLLVKGEEAVLTALRTALVENADNVEALVGMYDIYLRRQDWQRARFYLKQALALSPLDPELVQRARELDAVAPPP